MDVPTTAIRVCIVVGAVWGIGSRSGTPALCVGIVGIEMAALTATSMARSIQVFSTTSYCRWNGWCRAEAAVGGDTIMAAFFVDQHDHPDADCAGVT